MNQFQMFYREQRNIADINLLFLELVGDGLSREELTYLINKRPALWGRFSNWMDKLPSKNNPDKLFSCKTCTNLPNR